MIVVGLDISSKSTGWAILKNGHFYARMEKDCGLIIIPDKYKPAEKLVFFRDKLERVVSGIDISCIVLEDVYLRNVTTIKVLSRFAGVACELIKRQCSIEPVIVPTKALRKSLGTQDKEEVFNLIKEKYNLTFWEFDTHNDITDAIVAALYANNMYRGRK